MPDEQVTMVANSANLVREEQVSGKVASIPVPPQSEGANVETFAKDSQDYLRTFLQLADQKAAFVFTAVGAMLTALFSLGTHKRFLVPVADYSFASSLALAGMAGLLLSAGFAVAVVLPRESAGGAGLFYWGRIREFGSGVEYADTVLALSPQQLVRERLHNCRDLADVCTRKYVGLRLAFGTGIFGTATSVVYFLAGC